MPTQTYELLYGNAVKWIHENPQDQRISEEIKQHFLSFNLLPSENKVQLLITLNTLLKTTGLPPEIEKSLPWLMLDLERLPDEMLLEIGSHLKNESDLSNLVSTSRRMYSLFQPTRLSGKFLQQVAYGEQDKVEQLLKNVYKGNAEKRQSVLCCQSKFTDYSGRTFHCSAYEYAYWAKDTHMCRMLERYMNDATKAQMLACINEIERIDEATGKPVGLKYQQNDAEHRSAHFDLTPLITALQEYVNGYDAWVATNNEAAMKDAWMKVGMAQRDVPAHVAQEYCRSDRSFEPLPNFKEVTLLRELTFYNWTTSRFEYWFPLVSSNSGLGFDFTIMRGRVQGIGASGGKECDRGTARLLDLAAIKHLDEVRTADLSLSRKNLEPPALSQSMSV